jgi:N-acetylglucosamine-6-phosphate deacetylase
MARLFRGRHYRTGEPIGVECAAGRIQRIEPVSPRSLDDPLPWLAPCLVDLQLNGFAGVDFQRDEIDPDQLEKAVRALFRAGCGRFFLTLITDEWTVMLARLARFREWRDRSRLLSTAIAGWHIEGPFLSDRPGYRGAHDPARLQNLETRHLDELREVTRIDPTLITLAPERPGALEAIRAATRLGIRVSLGHTQADAGLLSEAFEAGASGFTHLGNACPQQLDRHDNIVLNVLDLLGAHPLQDQTRAGRTAAPDGRPWVSLIPDGIHVSPAFFRLCHRVLDPARIVYISDAMSAAGAPPGSYSLGRLRLEVGADRIVREPGQTNFAGSSLQPLEGVMRAARMLGQPWAECWDRFSVVPAQAMGLQHGLVPGCPAHFCALEETPPSGSGPEIQAGSLHLLSLLLDGEQVHQTGGHG